VEKGETGMRSSDGAAEGSRSATSIVGLMEIPEDVFDGSKSATIIMGIIVLKLFCHAVSSAIEVYDKLRF
jgi:hypothetical protein